MRYCGRLPSSVSSSQRVTLFPARVRATSPAQNDSTSSTSAATIVAMATPAIWCCGNCAAMGSAILPAKPIAWRRITANRITGTRNITPPTIVVFTNSFNAAWALSRSTEAIALTRLYHAGSDEAHRRITVARRRPPHRAACARASPAAPVTGRRSLSLADARSLALRAQRFGQPRPSRDVTGADLLRAVRAIGLVQIDSVNVLVRSHYLPVFSRLGPYAQELLDRAAYSGRNRRLFEYWGHEASLIPVDMQPLFRWRMERAMAGDGMWGGVARFGRSHRAFCGRVLDEIRDSRAARGLGAFRGRGAQVRLVGMERRQGGAGVAVLDWPGHHAQSPAFRTGV